MLNALPDNIAVDRGAPPRTAGELRIAGLEKRFGSVTALQDVSLTVGEGEIVSVTGPSGAGKSTLARLISGLETPAAGSITLGGQAFGTLPAQARRVAHMFESFALYPTRSVDENIRSPLDAPTSAGRWTAADKSRRVAEVLALTDMDALRDRLPSQLSGGQKQRVALCRALVQDPSVFVLDEPIGHLDAKLRHTLRREIRRRQGALRQGTLWLTPDGIEAMAVADRMVVLMNGRVQQVGTPDDVFARPVNVSVARLIGDPSMNVLAVELRTGETPALVVGNAAPVPVSAPLLQLLAQHARDGRLQLGLRPADLGLVPPDALVADAAADYLAGSVYAVEPLGKLTIVTVDVGGQRVRMKSDIATRWAPGAPVALTFRSDQVLCFDAVSGALKS